MVENESSGDVWNWTRSQPESIEKIVPYNNGYPSFWSQEITVWFLYFIDNDVEMFIVDGLKQIHPTREITMTSLTYSQWNLYMANSSKQLFLS